MTNELKKTSAVIRVLQVIGWILVAQVIISLVTFLLVLPLMFFIEIQMGSFWFSDSTRYEYDRIVWGLLVTAGFECAVQLILLFSTMQTRLLNRSMIWILTGWAVWHLFNAPLPMLGMEPVYCDSFFFYNERELSGWYLPGGLLCIAVGKITGIVLYLLWEPRRKIR